MNTFISSRNSFLKAVGTACLVLSLIAVVTYSDFAQAQCGQGQGKGTDINTCAGEILDEQERSLNLLQQMNQTMGSAGLLKADQQNATNRQIEFLRNNHSRGRNQKGDATDEEFDALVTKGKPSECDFVLLPRYHQGPPPRPVCDDTQIAANQCEQVCQFSQSQKEKNDNRGRRLEMDLADALEQTKIANDELETNVSTVAALSIQADAAATGSCVFDNPHPNLAPFPPASIIFHNEALVLQETITEIGKDTCQQDVLGNNGSAACIVFDILLGVQKGLTALVTSVDGNYTSAKTDAIFDCVNALKANSDSQGAQIAGLEVKIDNMQNDITQLRTLLDDVRLLLSTPQGQRAGFPAK